MQHMHALVRLAFLLTFLACKFDGSCHEQRSVGGGVEHLDQARVAGKNNVCKAIKSEVHGNVPPTGIPMGTASKQNHARVTAVAGHQV